MTITSEGECEGVRFTEARARFTWSEDMQDCDMIAAGFSDEEIDAMITAKAHEGAAFEGCKVEVA